MSVVVALRFQNVQVLVVVEDDPGIMIRTDKLDSRHRAGCIRQGDGVTLPISRSKSSAVDMVLIAV